MLGSTGVIDAGLGLDPFSRQRRNTIALNTFRVGPIQGQAGEELGCHAAAPAAVVVPAAVARTRRLRLPQLTKQWGVLPKVGEACPKA